LSELRGAAVELSEAQLLALYEWMLTGRILEAGLQEAGEAAGGGRRYPGSGQEAAQVGFAAALDPGDVLAPGHRDLLACLVRGITLEEALLDLFGKAAGRPGAAAPSVSPSRQGGARVSGVTADGVAVAVAPPWPSPRAARRVWPWRAAAKGRRPPGHGMRRSTPRPRCASRWSSPWRTTSSPTRCRMRSSPAGLHRPSADGYGLPGIVVDGNDVLEVYTATREA